MTERLTRLRATVDRLNGAGVRTTCFYALAHESLSASAGQPLEMRRALAQAHILENAPVAVLPDELIVGSMSAYCPVLEHAPDFASQRDKAIRVLDQYLKNKHAISAQSANRHRVKTFEEDFTSKKSRWALMSRVHHDTDIRYEDLQALLTEMTGRYAGRGLAPYEIGRELERAYKIDYGPGVKQSVDALPWFAANHLSLNYGRVIAQGVGGLEADIADRLERANDDASRQYYRAAALVARALSRFIERHAEALHGEAAGASGPRKAELMEMADICARIAREPARSFREAVQLMWLLHLAASTLWSSALSFGRFDQVLKPYYERDLNSGAIKASFARELLGCLWLKVNEPKMRTVQSLTIGGVTPGGEDATNALTALVLDVTREMQLPYPNVGVRLNQKNPDWLYDAVTEAVATGAGQPMMMTDEVWIKNLMKLGYDERTANDYHHMGCVEIMLPGRQPNWGVTDPIAFPMLIEDVFTAYRAGAVALTSFEAFERAYFDIMRRAIDADKAEADAKRAGMPGVCYDPLASLMIDGCLETGRDMFQGGSALGTHWSFYAYGLGTAADSLSALKKHVYEDERYTIDQMAQMLEADFVGYEAERAYIARHTPCYGNDDRSADELACGILTAFNGAVMALNEPGARDKYVSTLFGYFFHIYHGEITGATPNGRRAGAAFSDSTGPSQGVDVSGPTRMLNSALSLDHSAVTGGYALNIKLNPALVQRPTGKQAIKTLMKAYALAGGPQWQINFVDAETLKKAQADPSAYRHLIVRIGGYCEFFVNLDRALQDEIITRTVHGA